MTNNKFIQLFFGFIILLLIAVYFLVSTADAYGIYDKSWSLDCQATKNETLAQYRKMSMYKGAEVLFLGSSTSQNFYVMDIQQILGLKPYHASGGGAPALARNVLFKKAIQDFSELKAVYYIADFFEFSATGNVIPTSIYFQKKLNFNNELQKIGLSRPSFLDQLKDLYTYQSVEAAFAHIGRCIRKKDYNYFNDDGSTTKDILVNAITEGDLKTLAQGEVDELLGLKIDQNFVDYKNGAFLNYLELSPDVKILYKDTISNAKKNDIEFHIIISPLHKKFRERVLNDSILKQRYSEWNIFLKSLADPDKGIYVHDFNPHENYFPESAEFWRDGTHYSRKASYLLLQRMSKKE